MNPHTRAGIIPLEGPVGPIWFQWNPSKIGAVKAEAKWTNINVAGAPRPYHHFAHGDNDVIQFEIHQTRKGAPDGYIKNLRDTLVMLTKPIIPMAGVNRPPLVKFVFGNEIRETCLLISVSPVMEELFHPESLLARKSAIQVMLWVYHG